MLKIRREQMDAFRAYMSKRFEDDMVPILQEYFPEDCEVVGQEQARKVIRLGIERAERHGFETRGDVCDYICLMFALGSYFDEDPLLPWAAEALQNKGAVDPSTLMARLYAEAAEYSGEVEGVEAEYRGKALLRARRIRLADLAGGESADIVEDAKSRLRALYPQRYKHITERRVEQMIARGRMAAAEYGVDTGEGVLVYVALMFMLGTHFDRDPLYPWAAEVLDDKSATDGDIKARKLHAAAMDRLEQALAKSGTAGD